MDELIEWLKGEKYILPEGPMSESEERNMLYQISINRMIDKVIKKIQDDFNPECRPVRVIDILDLFDIPLYSIDIYNDGKLIQSGEYLRDDIKVAEVDNIEVGDELIGIYTK